MKVSNNILLPRHCKLKDQGLHIGPQICCNNTYKTLLLINLSLYITLAIA